MKRPFFRKHLSLFVLAVFLVSCNQHIIDFFEAIQDYGYRSQQPLGPKKVPVNDNLLGGYVYDELPVIISKRDNYTYEIKFLSVLLYKEDAIIEAHATQLGTSTFLNLAMGEYYCFMRVNLIMNQQLQIELLKDALKEYVPQEKIKSWLEKNPTTSLYEYQENGEDYSMEVYFSFLFERVTIQEALRIQENRLRLARMELFQDCSSYGDYETLVKMYPNDEFTGLAIRSLFNRCETIEDLREFIAYFPETDLAADAEARIREIIETQRNEEFLALDKRAYDKAKAENTIDSYEAFLTVANTKNYRDSANNCIAALSSSITRNDVEWKWTNGESEKAFKLLFYKTDHLKDPLEAGWIIELMTLYTLKYGQPEMGRKVLTYFDLLVSRKISGDDFLDLYTGKGFILWMLGENELCIKTFELKMSDVYEETGQSFKDHLKITYENYTAQGIVFPDQKNTWKQIKKLKPVE